MMDVPHGTVKSRFHDPFHYLVHLWIQERRLDVWLHPSHSDLSDAVGRKSDDLYRKFYDDDGIEDKTEDNNIK